MIHVGCLVCFLVGLFTGIYIRSRTMLKEHLCGTLVVDHSDPETPYLFLELLPSKSPETISTMHYVTFNVNANGYLGGRE